jgi:hypothetical protein
MPASRRKGTKTVKSAKRIVFVTTDDWAGLYVDGKLRFKNHSIRSYNIRASIGRLRSYFL